MLEHHPGSEFVDNEDTAEIPVEELRRRFAKSYPDLEVYESGEFPSVAPTDAA